MTPQEHRTFTERTVERLSADPDVLGVVGLGSTSGFPPLPDRFSDHDLFVVTRQGAQERFRVDLRWLPDEREIVLTFRETPHGAKALYASGHLVEWAAFDPDELALARVNRWAVLLDRADVGARMARVREATVAGAERPADVRWLAGQLLTELVAGAGRFARGERLAGQRLVQGAAAGRLVALLRAGLQAGAAAPLDDLDPFRRVERALPAEARAIDEALRLPAPAAARALLAVAARARPDLVPPAARAAVERAIEAAGG